MGQGVLGIDQRIQDLVIVRSGEIKQFADGLFLGPGVLPPLPLQGQYLLLALTQRRIFPNTCGQVCKGETGALLRHRFRRGFGHGTLLKTRVRGFPPPHVTGE